MRQLSQQCQHLLGDESTLPAFSVSQSLVVLTEGTLRNSVPAIIVAHNHPSGDPAPSPEDVNVTRQIVETGKLLDIEVLDHVIIGHQRYVSLKERGLGFD